MIPKNNNKIVIVLCGHGSRNPNYKKHLIIFKKAIFQSNFVPEDELLNSLKPLLNDETVWRPHALLLLGDFYLSKGENNKAREFYNEILSIKDLDKEFYKKASIQIAFTNDD